MLVTDCISRCKSNYHMITTTIYICINEQNKCCFIIFKKFDSNSQRFWLYWLQMLFTFLQHLCSSPVFNGVHGVRSLVFWVIFCRSLFVFLSFIIWLLYSPSFDLRLLFTSLISSNLWFDFLYFLMSIAGSLLGQWMLLLTLYNTQGNRILFVWYTFKPKVHA